MSSHKTYIKQLRPLCFITFDINSQWDVDYGNLLNGETIYDESENGANIDALLHSEYTVDRSSYSMGQPSMITNSPTNNYAIVLAPYEKDDRNDFPFPKTWIEIPHENRILLNKSFSISFQFRKVKSDSMMRSWIWDPVNEKYLPANSVNGYNYANLSQTIFRKGTKISLTHFQPWGFNEYLEVVFPNNKTTIQLGSLPGYYDRNISINMVHRYIVMDDGRYYTHSLFYYDNRVLYEFKTSPVFGNYDGGSTASFEIGGNQDAWTFNTLNDRARTPIYFDQFAIFDYALEPFQVSNIYKKIHPYHELVIRSFPLMYYQFNERNDGSNFDNIMSSDSRLDITANGNDTQILRNKPGIHGVYGSSSVHLQSGGMLYCKPYNGGYYSYFSPSSDFTIDFFAMFDSNTKGVLLSIQDDVQPFRGLCLFVNCRDNSEKAGSIQLSIEENRYIMTPAKNIRGEDVLYNDGVVRHYSIRRSNNYIELWINAVMIDRIYMTNGSLTRDLNQLYMYGLMPGNLLVSGSIQHLAFYDRALSQQELEVRSSYMIRYNILGRVTVHGIGQRILIRIMSFNTGNLLLESYTDSDGNYNINIPSDDYINFIVMDLSNINIRPRIMGPLLADTYEDFPFDY